MGLKLGCDGARARGWGRNYGRGWGCDAGHSAHGYPQGRASNELREGYRGDDGSGG